MSAGGILQHFFYALGIAGLEVVVDGRREDEVPRVLAPLGEAQKGDVLLWNEAEDALLTEGGEGHIDLLGGEVALLGNDALVDIAVVLEEARVGAQEGYDDGILAWLVVVKTVEVITLQKEHDARLCLVLVAIVDIAGAGENLKGRDGGDGEVTIGLAEALDGEFEGGVIA